MQNFIERVHFFLMSFAPETLLGVKLLPFQQVALVYLITAFVYLIITWVIIRFSVRKYKLKNEKLTSEIETLNKDNKDVNEKMANLVEKIKQLEEVIDIKNNEKADTNKFIKLNEVIQEKDQSLIQLEETNEELSLELQKINGKIDCYKITIDGLHLFLKTINQFAIYIDNHKDIETITKNRLQSENDKFAQVQLLIDRTVRELLVKKKVQNG